MKIEATFEELSEMMRRMGAQPIDMAATAHGPASDDPLAPTLPALVEAVKLSEVEDLGGLLTKNGRQVILYIKDTNAGRSTLLHHPEDARRFHVFECTTIQEMRRARRFERYVVTTDDTGIFECDWKEADGRMGTVEAELKVCKNCLSGLRWKGYRHGGRDSDAIWVAFSLTDFLQDYVTFFRGQPTRRAEAVELNRYVRNWSQLSWRYRVSKRWRCGRCGVATPNDTSLLHVHHVNGVRTDNSLTNLEALCVLCHRDEPYHQRMVRVSKRQKDAIERLRREQGIRWSNGR